MILNRAMLKLDDFLPYRLSVASNRVSETIARAYREAFGLSIAEWRTLAVAAENGGLTQQEVGQRTCMDKVTVSRAAIALTRRGLIARTHGPSDRRERVLELTAQGQNLYAKVVPRARALEKQIFGEFSPEELARLLETLLRIERASIDTAWPE
ncbi:MAG: MarR family winged helix-turn-helix transcriptional regulator [Sphingomonadales bacterium]